MTLSYCPDQDRIAFDCLANHTSILRLWITNRLMNQLVKHVLGKYGSEQIIQDRTASEGFAEPSEDSEPENSQPVLYRPDDPQFLVVAIDLEDRIDNLFLQFRGSGTDQSAVFVLPRQVCATWLIGIRRCFLQGGWSQAAWTDNLSEDNGCREPSQKVVLH